MQSLNIMIVDWSKLQVLLNYKLIFVGLIKVERSGTMSKTSSSVNHNKASSNSATAATTVCGPSNGKKVLRNQSLRPSAKLMIVSMWRMPLLSSMRRAQLERKQMKVPREVLSFSLLASQLSWFPFSLQFLLLAQELYWTDDDSTVNK